MTRAKLRSFGAFIDPDRAYVIEYRRRSTGIEVIDHMSLARPMPDIADAADAAAELINASAGRGNSTLTATIRGFGTSYHLLTLPPAGADVLSPIVEREMRRLFPDVEDPAVAFAVGGYIDRRTGKPPDAKGLPERRATEESEVLPLEILAAATPGRVVETLVVRLRSFGIQLDHLTVLPQAMSRLYREVSRYPGPSAVAMMLPGAPVIAVFQAGDVRFVAEPPSAPDARSDDDVQTVIDQVGRARIHLRRNYRGADVEKMFVAAEPSDRSHVASVLNAALNIEVQPLADAIGPPAALAALGGVLNAESGADMALYPSAAEMIRIEKRKKVSMITLAAAIVCILAIAFAAFNTISATRAAKELREERAAADAALSRIGPMMGVIEQRRANSDRIAAIQSHRTGQQQLARILNGMRLAQPPNVDITEASLTRTDAGWTVAVSGKAIGSTGAQVLRGVDAFYRELPRRVPLESLSLDTFDYVTGDQIVGDFRITFAAGAGTSR
ncbi:MAG TPA: hypothetical protein VMY38_06895 [Gemmatimonadaceae bacterium]|nr:hypothetical protein [Gemmatimonadaceae bacterium]